MVARCRVGAETLVGLCPLGEPFEAALVYRNLTHAPLEVLTSRGELSLGPLQVAPLVQSCCLEACHLPPSLLCTQGNRM